jgi:hypothetical protein
MPKSLFDSLEWLSQPFEIPATPQLLTMQDVEQVSGGRMKLPGPPVTVYYDDGITLVTSDPSKNTL